MTQMTARSTSTGHFELVIDGNTKPSYLKSVEGGFVKADVIEEAIGVDLMRIKHTTVRKVEPISAEVGLAGSTEILKWIRASWKRDWSRRNGHIAHSDYDQKSVVEQWYFDALIRFPASISSSQVATDATPDVLEQVTSGASVAVASSGLVATLTITGQTGAGVVMRWSAYEVTTDQRPNPLFSPIYPGTSIGS